ncbi:hypothetical protein JW872_01550 [Candidatus Babeliales bacterium]|nr:hypothetical protein [Candidatus Babeliales bacterium]
MKCWYVCVVLCTIYAQAVDVHFTSSTKLRNELCRYIDREQKSINAALYCFTDVHVARSLVRAHKRGVSITLLVCKTALEGEWTKVPDIATYDIPVLVYYGDGIMHHKFFIFGSNDRHKSCVWTGSYNPTHAATSKNCENVIIEDDIKVVHAYEREFKRLCRHKNTKQYRQKVVQASRIDTSFVIPREIEGRLLMRPAA